jgi:hypothetical protein
MRAQPIDFLLVERECVVTHFFCVSGELWQLEIFWRRIAGRDLSRWRCFGF